MGAHRVGRGPNGLRWQAGTLAQEGSPGLQEGRRLGRPPAPARAIGREDYPCAPRAAQPLGDAAFLKAAISPPLHVETFRHGGEDVRLETREKKLFAVAGHHSAMVSPAPGRRSQKAPSARRGSVMMCRLRMTPAETPSVGH